MTAKKKPVNIDSVLVPVGILVVLVFFGGLSLGDYITRKQYQEVLDDTIAFYTTKEKAKISHLKEEHEREICRIKQRCFKACGRQYPEWECWAD